MSTRAKYLARVLLDRSRALPVEPKGKNEAGKPAPEVPRERLRELVAKVLVVEEGITEESKIRLVLDALPSPAAGRSHSERDLKEFAECLEERLWQ